MLALIWPMFAARETHHAMATMTETCSICARSFDVQFRYQMEEHKGGYLFLCSTACKQKHMSGDAEEGVNCDVCAKHFTVELVNQVVRTKEGRKHACSEPCRAELLRSDGNGRSWTAFAPEASPALDASTASVSGPSHASYTQAPVATPVLPVHSAPLSSAFSTPNPPSVAPYMPAGASVQFAPSVVPPSAPRAVSKTHAPKRLAIFNHKGGTGKTTTTVSLAAGLAARGLKVLLVDTDSQGNLAVSFNSKVERSLYHVLVMGLKPTDATTRVRENLDLLASNETLAAAELYLAGRQNRDRILRDRLAMVENDYDVVLIDCSPSLSLMNQNALCYADGILIPVACDYLSLVGVKQVLKTVKNVNSLLHHPVQIFGVLPTFYDARARICRDAVDTMKQHFGDKCLSPIRAATKIKEAPAQGRTIFEYAPDSNAAEDYQRIVDFLVDGPSALQKPTQNHADELTSDVA